MIANKKGGSKAAHHVVEFFFCSNTCSLAACPEMLVTVPNTVPGEWLGTVAAFAFRDVPFLIAN